VQQSLVVALILGLGDADGMDAGKEAIRSMIERIVLPPAPEGAGLTIDIHGALAAQLTWPRAQRSLPIRKKDAPLGGVRHRVTDFNDELVLVAGGRNRRRLPVLCCMV